MTMKIPSTLRPYASKIDYIEDARHGFNNDGWRVFLRKGWIDNEMGTHQVFEFTLKDCASRLKDFVVKCNCEDCN